MKLQSVKSNPEIVQVRMPSDLVVAIKTAAKTAGITTSEAVRQILTQGLKELERQPKP
jgi:predicted DNA binding CopG/RHH family protein